MNYRLLGILCVMFSLSIHAQGQLLSTDDSEVLLAQDMAAQDSQPEATSWMGSLGHYTTQQIIAAVAGSLIVGYGIYKAYKACVDWYFPHDFQLTTKQRDILLMLTETMKQDVKQVRMGSRKPSLVKGLDVSGLGAPLDIECKYWQHSFVKLYNQCENNAECIDQLDAFCADFSQAINSLISRSRIV